MTIVMIYDNYNNQDDCYDYSNGNYKYNNIDNYSLFIMNYE